MTREQLDCIPDDLLRRRSRGASALVEWLWARGWSMSLLELDTERRARGLNGRNNTP